MSILTADRTDHLSAQANRVNPAGDVAYATTEDGHQVPLTNGAYVARRSPAADWTAESLLERLATTDPLSLRLLTTPTIAASDGTQVPNPVHVEMATTIAATAMGAQPNPYAYDDEAAFDSALTDWFHDFDTMVRQTVADVAATFALLDSYATARSTTGGTA